MILSEEENQVCWFVMRDLKRSNAKLPAYKMLANEHLEVFTPMKWQLSIKGGKRIKEEVPVILDLLFVHSTREKLDPIVRKVETLQYRYERGSYCKPMTVSEVAMSQFIYAISISNQPKYFLPGELTPNMYGRKVHIIGGVLNDFEGRLLSLRGSGKKRLIVELAGFLSVGVEVEPEYIELLE